ASDLIPPGTAPIQAEPGMTADATTTTELPPNTATTVNPTAPTQAMITILGLPPIPCGIFRPPPAPKFANPCDPPVVPAVMPRPGDRAKPIAPGQAYGAGKLPNATD